MIDGVKKYQFTINDKCVVNILDIKEMNNDLSKFIDNYIVKICEGDSGTNICIVKKRLIQFLKRKEDSSIEMGAVAEFFIHLFLNSEDFKQECQFFNLEENSIKKGFDGYYSKGGKEWIMESKSGLINTIGISHPNKIKIAYDDLKEKISGNVSNNPWQNAYNHASTIDVNTSKTIRNNIKKMSDKFSQGNFDEIINFNIIPTSTIFLNNEWRETDVQDLLKKIEEKIKKFKYKNIIIICITKISVKLLENYLRSTLESDKNE